MEHTATLFFKYLDLPLYSCSLNDAGLRLKVYQQPIDTDFMHILYFQPNLCFASVSSLKQHVNKHKLYIKRG